MKIGLDARLWNHPGMGRYLRELFLAMQAKGKRSFSLLAYDAARDDLAQRGLRVDTQRARSRIYSLGEQWELTRFAAGCGLLHVPHFNIPVLGAKRLVVTVHDLIYLKGVEHSGSSLGRAYVNFMFKRIERKADAVIAVSEYTKKDLLESFPKLKDRVFVTHEAASPSLKPATNARRLSEVKAKYGLDKPFVLFVGSLKKHKNVPVLLEAMRALRAKGLPHQLALAGRADPKETALLELIQENASWARRLGEVTDEELTCLYSACEVFVLPSLWEGFGLPALEAMACGAPVLASDRASIPEVVGKAGALFDPTRVDALSGLLYNVLNDSDLRQKMRLDGAVQAAKFSWDKTADQTLKVYEQVLR